MSTLDVRSKGSHLAQVMLLYRLPHMGPKDTGYRMLAPCLQVGRLCGIIHA